VVLKKLAEVVNVVPIIAKSDSLTLEERDVFKQRVSGYVSIVADLALDHGRVAASPDPTLPIRRRGA
jgi:septin 3/9/12